MRNEEQTTNYRSGQVPGVYTDSKLEYAENIIASAKEQALNTPVIIITEDVEDSKEIMLGLENDDSFETRLFTDIEHLNREGFDDWKFLQAKEKLLSFKSESHLVILTTKVAARGIDF